MTALVWRGKCLRMRLGKGSFPGVACSPEAKPATFRCRCEDRGPKPAETLAASGRPAYTGVGSGESKRKSRLRPARTLRLLGARRLCECGQNRAGTRTKGENIVPAL